MWSEYRKIFKQNRYLLQNCHKIVNKNAWLTLFCRMFPQLRELRFMDNYVAYNYNSESSTISRNINQLFGRSSVCTCLSTSYIIKSYQYTNSARGFFFQRNVLWLYDSHSLSLRSSDARCVSKPTIIGSDNGFPPDGCQAFIWITAGILLIWPLGTNFSEIVAKINTFSLEKCNWKCLKYVSASV